MNPITCTRSALLTAMVFTIISLKIHAEPEPAPTNGGQEHGISLLLGALVVRAPQFVGYSGPLRPDTTASSLRG